MRREEFLALSATSEPLLEIGPGASPIFSGDSVRYFDVMDADDLRKRFAEHGAATTHVPQRIDFVSAVGDLSIADSGFAFAASSHNIEHQPDLIHHLNQAAERLRPGGSYLLIIPDKRYCFDHFQPETHTLDVIAASLERRRVHTARNFLADRCQATHNDPVRHWAGDHGEPRGAFTYEQAIAEWQAANGAYIDVHAWYFTPMSFTRVMFDLRRLGQIPFTVEFVGDTPRDRFEFCARLLRI